VILIACGLKREAALLARPALVPIAGGGVSAALEGQLEDALGGEPGARMILSCGIAGALDPALEVGDVVADSPSFAVPGKGRAPVADSPILDPGLRRGSQLLDALAGHLPPARHGAILGRDRITATAAEKAALFAETGALAVDMESHVAARVAARHGLPYAAIRVISDTAAGTLPPAALVGMKPDGGMALGRVLWSLACNPAQLPALIRTGRDADIAFKMLGKVGDALAQFAQAAR